ncbi:MAG: YifB family Mg chelatase-like AAA ATPase [Bradymonadales bacterium]
MIGKVISGALNGVDGFCVHIEAHIAYGMTNFHTVGLAEGAVRESKMRVRAAFSESGLDFPYNCITLNLAPADIRKDGSAFDLPIAIAVLGADSKFMSPYVEKILANSMILGELALSGEIRPIPGALPLCIAAKAAGLKKIILPEANAQEAALVEGMQIFTPKSLRELYDALRTECLESYKPQEHQFVRAQTAGLDMAQVSGQRVAKRALEVAASGGHNIIFVGPPGSGKTMLAQRFSGILPRMSFEEALEVTALYSVSGNLGSASLIDHRPFRDPHHSISDIGLVGGGSPSPKPGEISLAHNGVLFLDELPEFKRNVLEVLRQPLENGYINITRRLQTVCYPAQFIMIASMNACPCGNFGSKRKRCSCTSEEIRRYQARISGPLLDRIDLQIDVVEVDFEDLIEGKIEESTENIRARVQRCRDLQEARFKNSAINCNARMGINEIRAFCKLDNEGTRLMRRAIDVLGMSARAYNRILKIARSIADMDPASNPKRVEAKHIAEAVSYRMLDRKLNVCKV